MNPRKVYIASDPVNAEIVKDYLQSYGLRAEVRDKFLWGGMGELPANVYPTVWIQDGREHDQARRLVAQLESGTQQDPDWHCPRCRELLAGQFDACWRCGRSRPTENV